MLYIMPSERILPSAALKHPFIVDNASMPDFVPMKLSLIDNLRTFCKMNALKKAALQVIAAYVEPRNVKKLKDLFTHKELPELNANKLDAINDLSALLEDISKYLVQLSK